MNVSNYEVVITILAHAMATQFNTMISDEAIETVPYDDSWANGTGYFDGLARENVATDHCGYRMFKSVDPHGRNLLLVRNACKQYVIFQRYVGNMDKIVVHYSENTRADGMRIKNTTNSTATAGSYLDALSVMDDLYQRAKREAARAD